MIDKTPDDVRTDLGEGARSKLSSKDNASRKTVDKNEPASR